MIDRQIRCLIESEFKHRKLNNYGFGGGLLTLLTLGRSWFISIEYWYGGNKLKLGDEVFMYKKLYGTIYDTFALFSDNGQQVQTIAVQKSIEKPEEADKRRFYARLNECSPLFI